MDLLFDPPWSVFAALGLVAVVLLYTGYGRADKRLLGGGLAAVVLAVAVYLIGQAFETDREKVLRETKELAAAVDKRDWPRFSSYLDPHVSFALYGGREQLTKGAEKTVEQVGVKNITLGDLTATPDPGGYTVDFMATADIDMAGKRAPTNWRFSWAKAGDHFLLYRIEPLPSALFGTDPVTERLARP